MSRMENADRNDSVYTYNVLSKRLISIFFMETKDKTSRSKNNLKNMKQTSTK